MTPTRGLRATKLELKGALGAPKEAPREPKKAMTIIDAAVRGFNGVKFWAGWPPLSNLAS